MSSQTPHTIVIVGGVAGGASAATRARRMNESARIIILEKDDHISFANCGLPYYIGGEIQSREKLLVATPKLFARRYNIEVRTRHEALAIDPARKVVTVCDLDHEREYELTYDRLILAPGAFPSVPPLPGHDADNVFTLRNLADTDRVKAYLDAHPCGHAVVVGAGFIGLEMVEQLRHRGMTVSLTQRGPQVLSPLDPEMAHGLRKTLEAHDVSLHLGDGLRALHAEDGRVTGVELVSGTILPADVVILAMGVRPNTKLAARAGLDLGAGGGIQVNSHLQTSDPSIYAVGDAAEVSHGTADEKMIVALAGPANRNGRLAGEHAATDSSQPAPPVLGTAIVRVFETTAAYTGLSVKAATRQGKKVASVAVVANNHAGYYPGAQPMMLKLVYDPETGRILGAQAVGGDGVDKRIDVIATAMHFGATVERLTELDLTYAPPFGSAKDPVHMVAFAASNQRAGLVSFTQTDADLEGCQVLDVRTDAEVARGMLPGAVHIPVDNLRERLGELDPSRKTVVVCQSGLRAYVACRILTQHGFAQVSALVGGMAYRQHVVKPEAVPAAH